VELPPIVELVLKELRPFESPLELIDHIGTRGLIPELVIAAADTRTSWRADAARPDRRGVFTLCPAGALNPFDKWGKCLDRECSVAVAERFARTVGLYAEEVVVMEPLSTLILGFDDHVSWAQAATLNAKIAVLHVLAPLLRAGVIRFGADLLKCGSCENNRRAFMSHQQDRAAKELKVGLQYDLRQRGDEFILGLYLEGDPTVWAEPIPAEVAGRLRKSRVPVVPTRYERAVLMPFVRNVAYALSRTVLEGAMCVARSRGTFATADTASARLFSGQDDSDRGATSLDLHGVQALDLPFISELTVEETLVLRDRAAKALPSLRAHLAASVPKLRDQSGAAALLAELQGEGVRVKSELGAIGRAQSWRGGLVTGSVAMALGVVAASSAVPVTATAIGAALAAVGLMHPHVANAAAEASKLKSLPGYVFVVAEDLLKHAS
jgi:hypothetical protein